MTRKEYKVALEISGPTAMWTRPDTGDAPVSYPAPTFSATKAIFESIVWLKNAEVVPTRVEICAPLVFHAYSTNYGGPLRKARIMKTGSSYQLLATVLINVSYRLYANVVAGLSPENRLSEDAHRYLSHNGRTRTGTFLSADCNTGNAMRSHTWGGGNSCRTTSGRFGTRQPYANT